MLAGNDDTAARTVISRISGGSRGVGTKNSDEKAHLIGQVEPNMYVLYC